MNEGLTRFSVSIPPATAAGAPSPYCRGLGSPVTGLDTLVAKGAIWIA